MPLEEAIEFAHSRGLNVVAESPGPQGEGTAICTLSKVAVPLRWERVPSFERAGPAEIDERLWFVGPCGQRDFLDVAGGHSYRGRLMAFCPHNSDYPGYHVSLSEMGQMSLEAEYFVKGYLCGDEPGLPEDENGDVTPEDLTAWRQAVQRFHTTGSWLGRWKTCEICGCVLLPDTAAQRCAEHADQAP